MAPAPSVRWRRWRTSARPPSSGVISHCRAQKQIQSHTQPDRPQTASSPTAGAQKQAQSHTNRHRVTHSQTALKRRHLPLRGTETDTEAQTQRPVYTVTREVKQSHTHNYVYTRLPKWRGHRYGSHEHTRSSEDGYMMGKTQVTQSTVRNRRQSEIQNIISPYSYRA